MYPSNGVGPKKKERKLSLIFKHTTANQHVSGVEALAVGQDCLYTASRDSLVKRWRCPPSSTSTPPACDVTFEGHVDWVNDVLLCQQGSRLVTCSSDRAVKIWQADNGQEAGRCLHTVQHHTDYVTCLAASEATGKLLSAGLHSEVIMYDMQTMQAHLLMPYPSKSSSMGGGGPPSSSGAAGGADQAADGYGAAAGAGGGQAAAGAGAAGGGPGGAAAAAAAPMRSVYALAVNAGGSVVAVGSTDSHIRLLDPRTGDKVMKLKGHKDNVRCLLLNADGSLLLSGSSDNTVRLWDLGQQRCIQTLNVHTDSVWCLAASPDFSVVYSGGRDKGVYCTHMGLRKAWLLAREQHPVRDIALADSGSRLWVATTSATVHGYTVPTSLTGQQQQQQQQSRQQQQSQEPPDSPMCTDQQQQQQPRRSSERLQQQQQEHGGQAAAAAQPPPSQQQQEQPEAAAAAAGLLSSSFGASPPQQSQQQQQAAAAAAGFNSGRQLYNGASPSLRLRHSMDPQAGQAGDLPLVQQPCVTIEGCPGLTAVRVLVDKRHLLTQDANGEVQLWDVLAGRPIEQLGKVSLADEEARRRRPLYVETWFSADVKLGALAVHLEPPKCFAAEAYALELGATSVPDDHKVNLGACLLRSALCHWARAFSRLHLSGAPLPGVDDPVTEQLPRFSPDMPPAVVSTSAAGTTWRTSAAAFTGREREGEDIPPWVCDAVVRGLLPYVKELKAAFVLHPAEGSSLPSLLQSRLNAPRILQVMKVANYCVTKLAELNVPLSTHAVGLSPDSQQPPAAAAADSQQQQQYLELTCNGLAVPYTFSIASVKRFIWKRSDDVIFHYRVLDPSRLAPFPNLGGGDNS